MSDFIVVYEYKVGLTVARGTATIEAKSSTDAREKAEQRGKDIPGFRFVRATELKEMGQ